MVHRRLVYIYLLNVPSFSSRYFNKIKRTSRLGRLLALSLEILRKRKIMIHKFSCSCCTPADKSVRLRSACASALSNQNIIGVIWVIKGPTFLPGKTRRFDRTAGAQSDLYIRCTHISTNT